MLASFIISLSSFLIGQYNAIDGNPMYPQGWEPMYPGLIAGLGIYFIGLLEKNLNRVKV
jgi:hypothetical protein